MNKVHAQRIAVIFSKVLAIVTIVFYSSFAFAKFNLDITFYHMVGDKKVETTRTIKSEYNKDIVITHENVNEQIVLNFKKVNNVVVNGTMVKPVQIDMKLVDEGKKMIGKPQTVTTFYTKAAQFIIPKSGKANKEKWLNLSLNFQDI